MNMLGILHFLKRRNPTIRESSHHRTVQRSSLEGAGHCPDLEKIVLASEDTHAISFWREDTALRLTAQQLLHDIVQSFHGAIFVREPHDLLIEHLAVENEAERFAHSAVP